MVSHRRQSHLFNNSTKRLDIGFASLPKVRDIGFASVEQETKVFAIILKLFPEARRLLFRRAINPDFLQTF
jgi:hypothetical protein